jgi:F420-non-reducing hydrogenase small subunit
MRPTVATLILGGCTGCHLALLDAHEGLLEVLGEIDLVHSPFTDGDEMPVCDVVLVEGAVNTEAQRLALHEARERAGKLIAIGACATIGGIGGLRNLYPVEETLSLVYGEGAAPDDGGALPAMLDRVYAVPEVVAVDGIVPGCAPLTATLVESIRAVARGEMLSPPRRNLCHECTRVHATMLEHHSEFVSDSVYAVMELEEIDPEKCFLEQGVICMGPMTREGCEGRCTENNVPCRGCMGPSRVDFEQGAKMVDVLASILPAGALMLMDDIIGTGCRYSLPVSVFPALVRDGGEGDV